MELAVGATVPVVEGNLRNRLRGPKSCTTKICIKPQKYSQNKGYRIRKTPYEPQ